jgi:hypothetical protein
MNSQTPMPSQKTTMTTLRKRGGMDVIIGSLDKKPEPPLQCTARVMGCQLRSAKRDAAGVYRNIP